MQGPLPRPGGRPTRATAAARRWAPCAIDGSGETATDATAGVHAADSIALQPGYRTLFELASGRARTKARGSSRASSDDAGLLATLRAALGAEEPLGRAFEQLARALEVGPIAESDVRERLRRALERCGFVVGEDGEALARALRESGQSREARWLSAGFDELGEQGTRRADRLAQALLSDWIDSDDVEAFAAEIERGLRMELRAAAPDASERTTLERWFAGESVGDLPRSVGVLLERALAHTGASRLRDRLLESLQAFELDTLPRPLRTALVRALGRVSESRREAPSVARLAEDLKQQLLLARGELARGPLLSAVVRTLAAIEAEQWINVARQAAHLSSHWSLPVRSGDSWSTAHLFVHRSYFRSTQAATGAPAARRMALALEAGELGIVQVELLVGSEELTLRVLAPSEASANALRARLPELERQLARGARALRTSVAVLEGDPPQALDPVRALSWLVDHNVVDMEV